MIQMASFPCILFLILSIFGPPLALKCSLRTLEFWVDNLNPDFLYPILSAQKEILVELMQGLTYHLRPAPYPYGLLTLRLLGKLGGKNRLWLGESTPVLADALKEGTNVPKLSIEGIWDGTLEEDEDKMEVDDSDDDANKFAIPLPIERATAILRAVACAPRATPDTADAKDDDSGISFHSPEGFLSASFFNSKDDIGGLNLPTYCADALEATKQEQASSALIVLRSALSVTVDLPTTSSSIEDGIEIKYTSKGGIDDDMNEEEGEDPIQEESSEERPAITRPAVQAGALAHIIRGLFYATQIAGLRDEAKDLLIGLVVHMLLICESHRDCIVSVDGDGRQVESFYHAQSDEEEKNERQGSDKRRVSVANGKIHSLPPFGNFHFKGDLKDKVSCFIINDVIVAMLCEGGGVKDVAIEMIREIVDNARRISEKKASDSKADQDDITTEPSGSLFFESLLSSLLSKLFASSWPCRSGIYIGIVELLRLLSVGPDGHDQAKAAASSATPGADFVALYEFELVHASLFCLKDCPRESPLAAKEALQFYFEVWSVLYGPFIGKEGSKSSSIGCTRIRDCVLVECEPEDMSDLGAFVPPESENSGNNVDGGPNEKRKGEEDSDAKMDEDGDGGDEPKGTEEVLMSAILKKPSPAIWELLLMEMCSTKQLLR